MSIKEKFRKSMLVLAIGLGLVAGAPIRPEEIEELMRQMNQTKIVRVQERDEG